VPTDAEERTCLHRDDLDILGHRQLEVEPALRLQDLTAANLVRRLGDLPRYGRVGKLAAELERVTEEAVAQQHGKFRTPLGHGGRSAAPLGRAVHDVVVHQRGQMHQFHHDGEVDVPRRDAAGGVRGEQNERGPNPFAAAFQRVADVACDARIEFLPLEFDPLLDRVEVAANGGELAAQVKFLRQRREYPMNRLAGQVAKGSGGFAHCYQRKRLETKGQT
jgi:hypothetical protein